MTGSLGRRGVMASFGRRVINILLHPQNEWQLIKDEQTTHVKVIARYGALIAAIPPVSAIA
jgi:hypothetical protein